MQQIVIAMKHFMVETKRLYIQQLNAVAQKHGKFYRCAKKCLGGNTITINMSKIVITKTMILDINIYLMQKTGCIRNA